MYSDLNSHRLVVNTGASSLRSEQFNLIALKSFSKRTLQAFMFEAVMLMVAS